MDRVRLQELADCFSFPTKKLTNFAIKLQQGSTHLPYDQSIKSYSSTVDVVDVEHLLREFLKLHPVDRRSAVELEEKISQCLKDPIKKVALSLLEEHLKGIEINENVILVKINKQYQEGMGEEELYELTRRLRPLSKRREKAQYAFSVFKGEVKEVYQIDSWYEAEGDKPGSVFTGTKAADSIRDKYVGQDISHYFQKFNTNQFNYVNC